MSLDDGKEPAELLRILLLINLLAPFCTALLRTKTQVAHAELEVTHVELEVELGESMRR